jgi:catechol 2,3-dioxygenase
MLDWYAMVLGMAIVHESTKPEGANSPLSARADWITNDKANHRIAIVSAPGLTEDHERSHHMRLQRVAFEFPNFDGLLATYARLKGQGIEPVLTMDSGATTAFYYEDPDRNIVELLADNFV